MRYFGVLVYIMRDILLTNLVPSKVFASNGCSPLPIERCVQDRKFAIIILILEFIIYWISSSIYRHNLFCRVTPSDHVFIACPISLIKMLLHAILNVVIFISDVELSWNEDCQLRNTLVHFFFYADLHLRCLYTVSNNY